MRRVHRMPFGAEWRPEGVRFRLWAPAARTVELVLEPGAGELVLPMVPCGAALCEGGGPLAAGFHELVTDKAEAGSRYLFAVDSSRRVPDPASRFNPDDVHGPSQVVSAEAFEWQDESWRGRPWEEAVVYELHVGAFTPEGTYAAAKRRLEYLAELGVTAVELMPLADFAGARGWGYDGVLPYAPDSSYGRPEELKDLVDAAHDLELMVLLDVVYNHLGPEGNYLHLYAPRFFHDGRRTPWGPAIDFSGPDSRAVRDFFIHNALYWLEEFHFDGLRLDAVNRIHDGTDRHVLKELAETVRAALPRERHVHLVLEDGLNEARYLQRAAAGRPSWYVAQWNDDLHHAMHAAMTGETDGYYGDHAGEAVEHVAKCLVEGFAYQGELSRYWGVPRGEPSRHLPPTAFVSFLQNHDQAGNRAFGERIASLADPVALRAAATVVLLAPGIPMLFMGEEFGAVQPFMFFCDFKGELAQAVRDGRRREFERFRGFEDPAARERIPDPNSPESFLRSKLDWAKAADEPHAGWLRLYRRLLRLREKEIVPRLAGMGGMSGRCLRRWDGGFSAAWTLGDGVELTLLANLCGREARDVDRPSCEVLFATPDRTVGALADRVMPPWSAAWFLGREKT